MPSFITLDGVDGVGKTTVSKALAEALGAVYFKSPSSPFDKMRADVDKVADPLTRYFFYRSATQHDSKIIRGLLDEGKSVVCDRYIYSTYAYHLAMDQRVSDIFEMSGLVQPDFRLLLTASHEVRWKRISARFADQSYDKHLERNHALQQEVASTFQTMGLIEIDTTHLTVMEVVKQALSVVSCGARP